MRHGRRLRRCSERLSRLFNGRNGRLCHSRGGWLLGQRLLVEHDVEHFDARFLRRQGQLDEIGRRYFFFLRTRPCPAGFPRRRLLQWQFGRLIPYEVEIQVRKIQFQRRRRRCEGLVGVPWLPARTRLRFAFGADFCRIRFGGDRCSSHGAWLAGTAQVQQRFDLRLRRADLQVRRVNGHICSNGRFNGRDQRQTAALGTQGVGHDAKRLGLPGRILVYGDVARPGLEPAQRIGSDDAKVFRHRMLFRNPAVEQLFQRPRGLAVFGQADHACAALERVKCAAQCGLQADVLGLARQRLHGFKAIGKHLARLFQEDFAQLGVFSCGRRRSWRGRRCHDRRRGGLRRGRHLNRLCGANRSLRRAPHQRAELPLVMVEDEHLLRQRRLVVQHVDHEPERAQTVAEPVKRPGGLGAALVDVVHQNLLDAVTHLQHCQRSLVQPEQRQHAAHLGQLSGHLLQHGLVLRVAEELVHRLFQLAHGDAQFAHDRSHGMAFTDAAVQVFHPALERLGLGARKGPVQPLRQALRAHRQVSVFGVDLVVRGLQIEHRGGDLHRDLGHRNLPGTKHRFHDAGQRLGQRMAGRVELDQGIADQAELVSRGLEFLRVSARKCGPDLLGHANALARLHQHGRIKTPEQP